MGVAAGRACGVHLLRFGCLLFAALLVSCATPKQQTLQPAPVVKPKPVRHFHVPYELPLNGKWKVWFADEQHELGVQPELPALNVKAGQPIAVPANWYKEGHDHAGAAFYQRSFVVPSRAQGKLARLHFAGVDYEAWVWVNGAPVGSHTGYFAPFSFDVTDHLFPGETNEVTVMVNSPLEKERDWSLRKRLIKGVLSHHDTRPGGAWSPRGQEKNTGGIWAGVKLRFTSGAAIRFAQIIPSIEKDGTTRARVKLTVAYAGHAPRALVVHALLKPANFKGRRIRSRHKLEDFEDQTFAFDLNPHKGRLWWPAGLGKPNLYSLTLKLRSGARTLDIYKTTFGYRTVRRDEDTGFWFFNGKRLFLKGTNYIPTQWMSEMSRADFRRDVRLMRKAHINAVRVHAHITAPDFYTEADAAGLLVWQDFPLQWGYSDDAAFANEALRQSGEMVRSLFNHPSIFAWSMQNEPPWDADWMKYLYKDYDPDQNRTLAGNLAANVSALDKTRYVHAFSATSEHPWFGWYSGHYTDYAKPAGRDLITEFGAQALPRLSSLKKIFGSGKRLWPDTKSDWDRWAYHNFQHKETFKNAKVEQGKNIHEFIRNTQEYQARLTKFAAEAYRRQKYQPVAAIFQFMFVEDWPSMNWGVVDYWRKTKSGYHALAKAYQPVLPTAEMATDQFDAGKKISLPLWVVNDRRFDLPSLKIAGTLKRNGKIISRRKFSGSVPADASKSLGTWEMKEPEAGRYQLHLAVRWRSKQIGKNVQEFIVK